MLGKFLTAAILTGSLAASAQQEPRSRAMAPDTQIADQRAAISRLDFMLGTWTGSGWMMLGPGQRAEFNQTETVQKKLEGTLITIDGDGRDKSNPDRIVHNAFAGIRSLLDVGFRCTLRQDPLYPRLHGWKVARDRRVLPRWRPELDEKF